MSKLVPSIDINMYAIKEGTNTAFSYIGNIKLDSIIYRFIEFENNCCPNLVLVFFLFPLRIKTVSFFVMIYVSIRNLKSGILVS